MADHIPIRVEDTQFYAEAMRLLDEAGIPYLVGGAFALSLHTGVIRDTKDFDLMMRERHVDGAVKLFQKHGYRANFTFTHWLAKVHHGELFIDIIYNSGNGLCPVDEAWFKHSIEAELVGRKVRLCPPEEMIWQKAYIMERERFDGADVNHLLQSCGSRMDWHRLLHRFESDWRILLSHLIMFGFVYPSETKCVPGWVMDELVSRLQEEISTTDTKERERVCKGTLLSRAQYLPDIERWGFRDSRLEPRCRMSEDEVRDWTDAIGKEQTAH